MDKNIILKCGLACSFVAKNGPSQLPLPPLPRVFVGGDRPVFSPLRLVYHQYKHLPPSKPTCAPPSPRSQPCLRSIVPSITIRGNKNGHKSIHVYADTILGVIKKKNGDIQYLIRFKTINGILLPDSFIDSFVMKTIYPQMVIKFYENLITWE
ncbi:Chromo domain-containing protein [Aphis craccivora]|uniref:Chromo domain-containing protein n=1 Tax=Aphis craccivora TaxID=307492 RepID=A0A6G0Z0V2_APHCR|nr:Chromo domain-containing protein [Aphis craccivora]